MVAAAEGHLPFGRQKAEDIAEHTDLRPAVARRIEHLRAGNGDEPTRKARLGLERHLALKRGDNVLGPKPGTDKLGARGDLKARFMRRLDRLHARINAQVVNLALPHANGMVDAPRTRGLKLARHGEVEVAHVRHDGKVRQLLVRSLDETQVLVEVVVDGDHEREDVRAVVVIVARVVEHRLERHLMTAVRTRLVANGERAELAVGWAGIRVHADLPVHLGDAVRGFEMTLTRDVVQNMTLRREGLDIAQVNCVLMRERFAVHAVIGDAQDLFVNAWQRHGNPLD